MALKLAGLSVAETDILVVVLGWMILCVLALVCISSYSAYQLYCKDSSNWINALYRNLTMIIMICFTLTITLATSWMFNHYISKQFQESSMVIVLVIKDIFYYTANILFYTLLLLRISVPFELNKCVKYSLTFVILLSAITSIVYIIMIIRISNDNYQIWRILLIILSCNDLILNLMILVIFVKKIKRTIIDIDPSISPDALRNVNVMMNVVAKHSILFGVSIFINQTFTAAVFISTFFGNGGIFSFLGDAITAITNTLDCTFNVLVLSLILRANYDKYICLCKYCHLCMAKCCFKNVDKKRVLDNPYMDLITVDRETVQSSPVLK